MLGNGQYICLEPVEPAEREQTEKNSTHHPDGDGAILLSKMVILHQ
jgi:hypothetical protein